MNRQNIQQIIRDLFKDNFNAYPDDYSISNNQQARLNARITAREYWENRTAEEIERDKNAGVTRHDYQNWCTLELKNQQDNVS